MLVALLVLVSAASPPPPARATIGPAGESSKKALVCPWGSTQDTVVAQRDWGCGNETCAGTDTVVRNTGPKHETLATRSVDGDPDEAPKLVVTCEAHGLRIRLDGGPTLHYVLAPSGALVLARGLEKALAAAEAAVKAGHPPPTRFTRVLPALELVPASTPAGARIRAVEARSAISRDDYTGAESLIGDLRGAVSKAVAAQLAHRRAKTAPLVVRARIRIGRIPGKVTHHEGGGATVDADDLDFPDPAVFWAGARLCVLQSAKVMRCYDTGTKRWGPRQSAAAWNEARWWHCRDAYQVFPRECGPKGRRPKVDAGWIVAVAPRSFVITYDSGYASVTGNEAPTPLAAKKVAAIARGPGGSRLLGGGRWVLGSGSYHPVGRPQQTWPLVDGAGSGESFIGLIASPDGRWVAAGKRVVGKTHTELWLLRVAPR